MQKKLIVFDTEFNYIEKGEGRPIMILHGGGGPELMLDMMGALSKNFHVIVPTHPGFNGEDEPDWLERPSDIAYFYLQAIKELGLSEVVLVGHSLGGWVAAEMAVRDQSCLAGLCLISSAGIHVKGVSVADNFLWSREETFRKFFVDQRFSEKMLEKAETNDNQILPVMRQRILAKIVWRPRWYESQLQKWLVRISIPTQIIWGSSDALFPKEYGDYFAQAISAAKLTIINDCGHIPFVEKEAECFAVLESFLQET